MQKIEYFCDRCGKPRKKCRTNITMNDKIIRDVDWVVLMSATGYQRSVDLCQDCLDEFAKWMEGANK